MKTRVLTDEHVESRIVAAIERVRRRIDSRSIGTKVVKLGEAAGAVHAQLQQSTNRELNIEG